MLSYGWHCVKKLYQYRRRATPHNKRENQAYFQNSSCTHKNFKNTFTCWYARLLRKVLFLIEYFDSHEGIRQRSINYYHAKRHVLRREVSINSCVLAKPSSLSLKGKERRNYLFTHWDSQGRTQHIRGDSFSIYSLSFGLVSMPWRKFNSLYSFHIFITRTTRWSFIL